jgi:DNA replication factor GINS
VGDARDERTAVERTTVRITADVGEIFGVDEREYHLETDQIVTLPAANAEPLLERDAAERVER